MKFSLPLIFFLISTLTLSAQCFDYQSEIQNVENFVSGANRSQEKALKSKTRENARQLLNKSAFQLGLAITDINMAREYASACGCDDGVNSTTNLYNLIFDYRNLTLKIAKSDSTEELKARVKENMIIGESLINEITEALVLCPTQ